MSWLQTPECLPDDVNQELVRMSEYGSSERSALIECICDALSSLDDKDEAIAHAAGMCDEFIMHAKDVKEYFEGLQK